MSDWLLPKEHGSWAVLIAPPLIGFAAAGGGSLLGAWRLWCVPAKAAGAGRLIAIDTSTYALNNALTLGATHTINPDDVEPKAAVYDTLPLGPDLVVEAAGPISAVELARDLRRRGTKWNVFGITTHETFELDGKNLEPPPEERIWIVMNKSRGVLTTRRDMRGRVTIFDGLPPFFSNLIPVGRLDMDTDGVILLTNDGDLANRLMHPRYEIERIYEALVDGVPSRAKLRQMRDGIDLGDSTPGRAEASIIAKHPRGSVLRVLLKEGRNREVKRLCEAVGHRVQRLRRISFAGITAKGIDRGGWRKLSLAEIGRLERVPKVND